MPGAPLSRRTLRFGPTKALLSRDRNDAPTNELDVLALTLARPHRGQGPSSLRRASPDDCQVEEGSDLPSVSATTSAAAISLA